MEKSWHPCMPEIEDLELSAAGEDVEGSVDR
jgi:hypothetical protein